MSNFLYFLGADNKLLFNFLIAWNILNRTKRLFRNSRLKFGHGCVNGKLSNKFFIFHPTWSSIASVEKLSVKILSNSFI